MENTIRNCRTKKENILNLCLCVIGALLWIGIFYGLRNAAYAGRSLLPTLLVFAFYGGFFVLFLLFSALAFRATAMGNMILLGQDQFPHLHQMVKDGAQTLGMESAPEAFLFNSNGILNAYARRIFGRKYILLTSSLVDASKDEQVRFVIGHELGHHAAGHLNPYLSFLRLPARFVPFLYSAYSRQREYTCDRIGFLVSRDVTDSCAAIQMLGCGCQRLNSQMNIESFEKQEALVPPVFGFLTEIFRSHPRLTRRVAALKAMQL